jgi:predicted transcriptional regulator
MSTKTLADKGFILAGKPDAEPMYTMTQKGGKLIELIDLEKPRKDFSKY